MPDIAAREQYLRQLNLLTQRVRVNPSDYETWGAINILAHRIYAETPDAAPRRYGLTTRDGRMVLMPLRQWWDRRGREHGDMLAVVLG